MHSHTFKQSAALASVLLAGLCAVADAVDLRYDRTEDFAPPCLGQRRRRAPKTFLYAEFLNKYGQFQNYLQYWIDRPLFWDRATRPERFAYETPQSFAIHAAQLVKGGLDGFDVFVSSRHSDVLTRLDDWFVQDGTPGLNILPIVTYGESVNKTGPDVKGFASAIRVLQGRERTTRIGGKVLVPTYNYRMFSADQHRKFLAALVSELGNDDFILCGDIDMATLGRLRKAFHANGRLSAAETDELERAVREVLDAAGGLQLIATEKIRDPDGEYCSRYDLSFFDTCLAPLAERLYALPEYAEKILGFYVHQGYINHLSGHDHSEDGTGTLRRNLRSVFRLNPDYLIFFEWNEVNENTMFQPTVWSGQTVGRLLRWHSRFLKGLPPDPYPGDDMSIPPLALTYRATAKVGETLLFEMLNIPDGVFAKKVSAQLRLTDADGRAMGNFPVERIDTTQLGAVSYRVSTADIAGGTSIIPTLVVDGREYSGFAPIRIAATVAWNYKTVRQNLRDMLVPEREPELRIDKTGKNEFAFGCKAAFREPLASLELVENENEQAAMGAEAEYDFMSNIVIRLAFSTPRSVRNTRLSVRVRDAKGCRFAPNWIANVNSGTLRLRSDGEGFETQTLFWSQEVTYFIQVPKACIDAAVVEVSVTGASGFTPARIPVKTLAEAGVCGAVLDAKTSFRCEARRVYDLPDLPPHIRKSAVEWSGTTETRTQHPVYHFRAIAESGRIWRSRPIRPDAPQANAPMTTYPVFDEFARQPAAAKAPASLIPEISYRFDAATGAMLANTWEPAYNACLGGGFHYCEAYSGMAVPDAPDGRAPSWTTDEGVLCLAFDGLNDYLNFPREAFPQAAFTLEMEVKPEFGPDETMTLFRHFGRIRGSLSLFIEKGKLVATWGDKNLSREPCFRTDLAVSNGAWNKISVGYDFSKLTFTVNGQTRAFPWRGRAWAFKPSIFGGHDKAELAPRGKKPCYFKGLLRKIAMRHAPPAAE